MEHGDGFPLLFHFLKFIIFLFISMFVLQGLYFFISMLVFRGKGHSNENINLVNVLSVDYIVDEEQNDIDRTLVSVYEWLALSTNVLVMILTCVFWVKQVQYKVKLDQNTKTDSDFGVMMYNLPKCHLSSELKKKVAQNTGLPDSEFIYSNK